jgi:hypothetical protein
MTEEFSLVDYEDEYVANKPHFAMNRAGLYPSEASVKYWLDGEEVVDGGCHRASWYRVLGVPVPGPPNVSLNMKASLGKWDEIGTTSRWKEMGIWVDNAVKFFNKELVVSGELDAIIKNPHTGKLIGIEQKSFYNYAANKEICGSKKDQIPGKPKMSHFLQSAIYAWDYRNILDEYRIYYLERGDGHRVEFRVGFIAEDGKNRCYWEQIPGKYWSVFQPGIVKQPFYIEDIHARYKQLGEYIKTKKLPPRDYPSFWPDDKIEWLYRNKRINKTDYEAWVKKPAKHKISSWQCSYCNYRSQCEVDDATS